MATQKELRKWLIEGELERVVDELTELAEQSGDAYYQKDVIHQAGRFNGLKKRYNAGVIDADSYQLQLNQIQQSLLELIKDLPKAPTENAVKTAPQKASGIAGATPHTPPQTASAPGSLLPNLPWIAGLVLLIGTAVVVGAFIPCPTAAQSTVFRLLMAIGGGLAAIKLPGLLQFDMQGVKAGSAAAVFAMIYLINPARAVMNDGCGPFEFTISLKPRVTGAGLYPKLDKGTVQLFIENKWESTSIDADGLADFKSLPGTLRGKRLRVRLNAPYWKLTEGAVSLNGKSTTLEAIPDGSLAKVSGQILNEDGTEPLPGVSLLILTERDTTDEFGQFEVMIPSDMQRLNHSISARKSGYQTLSEKFTLDGGPIRFRMLRQ
ncbi:MAG: hypothetical protein RIC19_15130 [Phaeodactylibacter sp.]|uniref:hypothetical protein n=1 Tax=Phaeodactylibacter sp. TaxID=1940289 RepID=UPI0032EFA9FB